MSDWSVEYSDDGGVSYTTIDWADFTIEWGMSDIQLAPLASVDAGRQVGASAGDILRIQKNGVTKFDGTLTTGGEIGRQGQNRLRAEHDAYRVFADSVSINETNPTDQDVLSAALSAASGGGNYTLTYNPTPVSLNDDYEVDDRKVKRIFRDMTDRTDRVFYVGIDDTIEVVERGAGNQFAALSAGDGFRVESYNPGDIDTVRNAVTVNGTGGEQVQSTETDSTSISEYGRRSKTYNFEYITSAGEASSMASELLIPDPLPDAELLLGTGVGAVADIQLNKSIDFDDSQGTGASDVLTIEKQTVTAGSTTVDLGEGAGVSIANVNRDSKSVDDNSLPGSVYNTDRIADGAIDDTKIVDLSITETEIADDVISTPKLQANAVEANNIAANQITSVEIDTLDLATTELSIGTDADVIAEFGIFTDADGDDVVIYQPATNAKGAVGTSSRSWQIMTSVEMTCDDLDVEKTAKFDNPNADEITVTDISESPPGTTSSFNEITFLPSQNVGGRIGTRNSRWRSIYSQNLNLKMDDGGLTIRNFATNDDIVTDVTGTNDASVFRPKFDNTCLVGTGTFGFSDVIAHNFTTLTPEPMSVDASSITDYSWEQPPLEVCQKKASANEDVEYKRRNPADGIDLSHMANYLFEACKDQQETIESQADRIGTLESTVDDLESRLAELEAKQE